MKNLLSLVMAALPLACVQGGEHGPLHATASSGYAAVAHNDCGGPGLGGCCEPDITYAASLWSNYCAERHPWRYQPRARHGYGRGGPCGDCGGGLFDESCGCRRGCGPRIGSGVSNCDSRPAAADCAAGLATPLEKAAPSLQPADKRPDEAVEPPSPSDTPAEPPIPPQPAVPDEPPLPADAEVPDAPAPDTSAVRWHLPLVRPK